MNKAIVFGAIVAVLVLAGIVYFVVSKPGPQEEIMPGEITLNVSSDEPTYTSGEEIRLTLQLSNAGEAETCVSDMVDGTIRVVSFTRNGEEVTTRSAPVSFIEHLPLILEKSLTALQPGESLDITMLSWVDPGLGKQALEAVALSDSGSVATFYEVETPGEYDLTLVYEYSGALSPGCPSVFQEETNLSGVTFTVTP